jgi:2'-5' RNA ligase
MASIGFPREERGFSAHITVGRLRNPADGSKLTGMIERMHDKEAGSFRVGSIALMKSELRPNGAAYTPLAEFDLK